MSKKIKKKPKYNINRYTVYSYRVNEYDDPDYTEYEDRKNKRKRAQIRKPHNDEYYE